MKKLALIIGVTALVAAWCAPAPAQHVDKTWGFKIRTPKDWRKIPQQVAERWIIGKYQSKKNYFDTEGWEFKPEMKIIVFPEKRKKEKSRGVEVEGDTIRLTWKAKYKNYKEYLKSNFAGGGYYFTKEEEGKIGGVPVSKYEIKVEKLATRKMRIVAFVYHLGYADIAVDFGLLENRYKKMRGFAYSSLKSFRLAERTKPASQSQTPSGDLESALKDAVTKKKKKLTPLERAKKRKSDADKVIKAAIASLPKGWKVKKSNNFTALTHVDARFTKKMLNQAEAIRGWLDKNLGDIGGEYVPQCILRVCIDSDEESAYRKGSRDGFSMKTREITVAKKTGFSKKYELEWLSARLHEQWFSDKNQDLYWALPGWIDYGLKQYVGTATAKGRKLVFKPDEWEKTQLRQGKQKGTLVKCRDLMRMTGKEFRSAYTKGGGVLTMQSGSLVRYLFSGKRKSQKLVAKYLKNLNDVVTELKKKEAKKSGRKEAETEEEEEEMRKKRAENAKKQAKFVVDEAFKRTFSSWTDKDWSAFERGWAKAAL